MGTEARELVPRQDPWCGTSPALLVVQLAASFGPRCDALYWALITVGDKARGERSIAFRNACRRPPW
jgi:hypothetical protein